MFALLSLALIVSPTPERRYGVQLEDAKSFKLEANECRKRFEAARSHATDQMRWKIWANNDAATAALWEAECAWRAKCWDLLDDVLFCTYPPGKKLHSLIRLREMIGDDDYFAGRMPCPTPTYRTKP